MLTTRHPYTDLMIFYLCLRKSESEANSRLIGPGHQWATESRGYYIWPLRWTIGKLVFSLSLFYAYVSQHFRPVNYRYKFSTVPKGGNKKSWVIDWLYAVHSANQLNNKISPLNCLPMEMLQNVFNVTLLFNEPWILRTQWKKWRNEDILPYFRMGSWIVLEIYLT